MNTTLVIMAAGIGSRFGGGVKQLTPIGPNGELIIDYSIHDAISAGFNKIVFIIRKDIEKDFKDVIGDRVEKACHKIDVEVAYAFQELGNLPDGISVPPERKKPWGTGQAVLAVKNIVHEPFVVINADDYYGKEAFIFMKKQLMQNSRELCMAGYLLKNTLSENGGVTRGICSIDDNGYLNGITETYDICKVGNKAISNDKQIPMNALVSMNMWGLTPEFLDLVEEDFVKFFDDIQGKELTAEYVLPTIIGKFMNENKITVKVIPTSDVWFGVTYKEDRPLVINSIRNLISKGVYSMALYTDLFRKMKATTF